MGTGGPTGPKCIDFGCVALRVDTKLKFTFTPALLLDSWVFGLGPWLVRTGVKVRSISIRAWGSALIRPPCCGCCTAALLLLTLCYNYGSYCPCSCLAPCAGCPLPACLPCPCVLPPQPPGPSPLAPGPWSVVPGRWVSPDQLCRRPTLEGRKEGSRAAGQGRRGQKGRGFEGAGGCPRPGRGWSSSLALQWFVVLCLWCQAI